MAYNFGCVLLGCMHLLLLWNFSAVRGQDFYNYTYPGTFRSSPSDLYALKQLWNAWNSTPDVSNNLAGWNALVNDTIMTPCVPESPWRGVYCNAVRNAAQSTVNNTVWDLDIVSLVLDNVSLKGTIPAGIANLSNLVTVSVTRNPELTGPLPVEAENLYSLFQLDLHGNSITGELPQWNQDSFPFLQTINVAENKMTGEMLTNLTNSFRAVQTLNLSYNSFHGEIIDVFFYLHKAVSMDLSHNNFNGSMPNLTSVTVEGTNLQSWGPLSYLDLSSNKFTGSLPNMNGHQTLQFFNISQNQFSGELNPEMLSNVSTLETMDLSHNQFTGSISNLANLISLRHLDLSYNNFSPGSFPTWTVDLIHLQILSLRGLSLSGSVPFSVIAGFQSLQTLKLDDNNLTGTLDLNHMPTKSSSLQLVSLTNNKIEHVAYLGRVANIIVKFNLLGNPYCDNSASETSDLKRCMCQQICLDTRGQSNRKVIIIASVGGSMLAAVIIVYSLIFWRSKKEGYKLLLGAEQKFAEYEVKPTIYTYSELQAITKSFNTKLGHGAFGVVYKGTLSNGVEVAVKQLYPKSQQSLDDFLNEIVLVTAVKHRNLVKLKGCCIRKDQRLLVYEYVENGDLDQFLFGNEDDKRKDWTIRRNICYEVAEGIQYLHFANQPKIIHRDIKACNILLDKNMEPKIADFGLALLYPNEESRIMTIHVAGTRGYLAPEYAHLGLLSEKVDVFSYGVMLLEIVSGRRNLEPTLVPEDQFYLPDWAWQLHIQGRITELIDPMLDQQNYHHNKSEAIRIIYVALLCVHKEGDRRPDMKTVVAMLHGGMDNEVAILIAKHECDHILSARSRESLGDTDSSLEISSLMSRDYVASNHSNSSLGDHNMFSPLYVDKNHLS